MIPYYKIVLHYKIKHYERTDGLHLYALARARRCKHSVLVFRVNNSMF